MHSAAPLHDESERMLHRSAFAVRLHERALEAMTAGGHQRADALAARALRLARECGPALLVASVLDTRAKLARSAGRPRDAASFCRRALFWADRAAASPDAVRLRRQLSIEHAILTCELGSYDRALRMARAALAAARRLGPRSPELVAALNAVGFCCKYSGRWAEGERCYRRALRLEEKAGNGRSDAVATLLHNLGGIEHARGGSKRAVVWARRGLALRKLLYPARHPAVAADAAALAPILSELRRFTEAEELLLDVVRIYRHSPDWYRYELAVAYDNLATLRMEAGRPATVERLYRDSIRLKRRALGSRHADLALTLNNLAAFLASRGRAAAAAALCRLALQIFRGALGRSHPHTLICERNCATLDAAAGGRGRS
jgi:tetratricopeptide (TPR) repeat protein